MSPFEEPEGPFDMLVSDLQEAMQALGLHSDTLYPTLMGEPPDGCESCDTLTQGQVSEYVKAGVVDFVIIGQFRTADLAWSDRILHPDRFDEDLLLREVLPSEEDALQAALQEQIDNGVAPEDVVIPDEFKNMKEK